MHDLVHAAERLLHPPLSLFHPSSPGEALETLIAEARTSQGRARLASANLVPFLLDLVQSLDYSSDSQLLLLLSLKLLRNLCAGETANQDAFLDLSGTRIVLNLLGSPESSDSSVVRFGLQLLGNVALAGEKHQKAVWNGFFGDDGFARLARVRCRETIDPLCMILYTCCDGCPELLEELRQDEGLCLLVEIVQTVSAVGFAEEWFKLVIWRTCLSGSSYFPQLFHRLQEDTDVKDVNFSSEQAFLLQIISEILNERVEEVVVPIEFASSVLGILKRSISVLGGHSTSGIKSGLPTGSASIDVLGYSTTILRDVCSGDYLQNEKGNPDSGDIVDTLISSGLLDVLLQVLRDIEPPAIIRKALEQREAPEGPISQPTLKACPYRGFRRDIVAVIGNCCYRRTRVQDYIRHQQNGILLMLQQCVTDEENPFLREWGIWGVRNLLEDNIENQKLVADLEVQGSVDVPELTRLGLKMEIDQTTRRPKLVNLPGLSNPHP